MFCILFGKIPRTRSISFYLKKKSLAYSFRSFSVGFVMADDEEKNRNYQAHPWQKSLFFDFNCIADTREKREKESNVSANENSELKWEHNLIKHCKGFFVYYVLNFFKQYKKCCFNYNSNNFLHYSYNILNYFHSNDTI